MWRQGRGYRGQRNRDTQCSWSVAEVAGAKVVGVVMLERVGNVFANLETYIKYQAQLCEIDTINPFSR